MNNKNEVDLGLTIDLIAAGMALLVVLTLPIVFFLLNYAKETTGLETRLEMYAALIEQEPPCERAQLFRMLKDCFQERRKS